MNSLQELIKKYIQNNFIRNIYKILRIFFASMYDCKRFIAYGGWSYNMTDMERRNYEQVFTCHSLERSFSFKKRKPNWGWRRAYYLLDLLNIAKQSNSIGYYDKASKQILEKFIGFPENFNLEKPQQIKTELEKFDFNSNESHGAMEYSLRKSG